MTKKTLPLLASALALSAVAAHAETPLTPTIGRIVHYYPGGVADIEAGRQPRPAMICQVWNAHPDGVSCVNVGYLDAEGSWLSATSVALHSPNSTVPETGPFALWMPFQSNQAKAPAAGPAARPPDAVLVKTHDNGEPLVGQPA